MSFSANVIVITQGIVWLDVMGLGATRQGRTRQGFQNERMKMDSNRQADLIKIAAICTAIPRWTGALLASEGFQIPDAWLGFWISASALLAVGMAITEAMAFSFIFSAWRNQRDRRANRLFALAIFSALAFVYVLSPYIAGRVRGVTVADVLTNDIAFWLWTIAVGASTILIIVSVGYAQRQDPRPTRARVPSGPPAVELRCFCGYVTPIKQAMSAHTKKHKNELSGITTVPDALSTLARIYPERTIKPSDVRRYLAEKQEGNKDV